jgi:HPt (histidine-containing phosphotransfer) domain-containing protein
MEFSNEIDLSRFEELSDGDKSSLLELLELYLSKTTEQLRELETAVASKASADIARIAHSMIGANAMMGMNSILPALKKLEAIAEKGPMDEAQPACENIVQEYKRIHTVLKYKATQLQ